MFNDRDLLILGGGALLAIVIGLIPPVSLIKAAIGVVILVAFMVLALLRLGPDRVTVEEWLKRRLRYAARTRFHVFQHPPVADSGAAQAVQAVAEPVKAHKAEKEKPSAQAAHPVSFALNEVGIYPLATAWMVVLGVYFVIWIINGGGQEIAWSLKTLIGR
jgi:hypothetical protein